MKTIAVEKLDHRVVEALKQQEQEEPVLLTENSKALGLLVRLPQAVQDTGVDAVWWTGGSGGPALLVVQAACHPRSLGATQGRPVFGSGRGSLTVIAEDEEHLKDFAEYMR